MSANPAAASRPERRLRRDAERNRVRILAAAAEAFAEGGLAVTMDEIARRAGVGVGTVYRRFPDKEQLIEALFEQRIDDLVALAEEAAAYADAWAGLVHFFESVIAVLVADRGLKEVVLSTRARPGARRAGRGRGSAPWSTTSSRARRPRASCGPTSRAPTSGSCSSCSARWPTRRATSQPELWRRFLTIVLDGLRTRRDAPSPLGPGPLDEEQLDRAMAAWRPAARGRAPRIVRESPGYRAACALVARRAGRVGSRAMRVGLVLGAGGVIGGSWLMGALEALEAETGWRAADAEQIVGTSAGAVIGALAAAGVPPEYMSAYAAGAGARRRRRGRGARRPRRRSARAPARTSCSGRSRRSGPGRGAWRCRRCCSPTATRPPPCSPGGCRAGSSRPRRSATSSTPSWRATGRRGRGSGRSRPTTRRGRRVAFGRDDAPPATLAEAVAASCAIPGFYHPVTVAGRRYVDGGICSVSNLDLLCGEGLDLVICLNPMSSLAQATGGSPADRMAAIMRSAAGRRLGHEARKLREAGTRVLILQPAEQDVALMGFNLMSGGRRLEVMEQARRSVANELRGIRDRGAPLPDRAAPAAAAAPAPRIARRAGRRRAA